MTQTLMLFKVFVFPFLMQLVYSTCAFTQTCTKAPDDCNIPEGKIYEPSNYIYDGEFQCPEFAGKFFNSYIFVNGSICFFRKFQKNI